MQISDAAREKLRQEAHEGGVRRELCALRLKFHEQTHREAAERLASHPIRLVWQAGRPVAITAV